jgi:hypothetical protein
MGRSLAESRDGWESREAADVHPVSTLLFLAGYGLAIPIALQLGRIVAQQHRMALVGHQVGIGIAAVAWLLRGRVVLALLHMVWAIGVRVWFDRQRIRG